MGSGDDGPEALRQMGANVKMINGAELAGRPVCIRHDRARHPGLRGKRRRDRQQQTAARLRLERRDAHSAVQQERIRQRCATR